MIYDAFGGGGGGAIKTTGFMQLLTLPQIASTECLLFLFMMC